MPRRPKPESGIDFSKYSEIPVEVELPRGMDVLAAEMQPVENFADLQCGAVLGRNLAFAGFSTPTPVQANSGPMAIGGLDVISVAQTGSGKTLAFMLPILFKILQAGSAKGTPGYRGSRDQPVAIRALALAPTRELAVQIHEESKKFAFRTGIRVCVAYGGTPFGQQMRELERGCDVLVATPGRLDDMVERGRVTLSEVKFLVLDEADRMLDMGFEPQIRNIVEGADMPGGGEGGRQTMMFSATFPKQIRALANSFLVDPIMLKVHARALPALRACSHPDLSILVALPLPSSCSRCVPPTLSIGRARWRRRLLGHPGRHVRRWARQAPDRHRLA